LNGINAVVVKIYVSPGSNSAEITAFNVPAETENPVIDGNARIVNVTVASSDGGMSKGCAIFLKAIWKTL